VAIVGGGFGGLACARALARAPVEVILLDRNDHHEFTPLLYQVATALLTASDIAYPFRAAFQHAPNVRFHRAFVNDIDLDRRAVLTASGERVEYDYLVLACGSEDDHFGSAGLEANTLSIKSLAAAQRLREHILACLEQAARAEDELERRRWLSFVVIGGGPTGVEFTGALVELLALVLGRDYRELQPGLARVTLVEGGARLLPSFPPRLGRYAARVLARRGVEVLTGTLVETADGGGVRLADGRQLPARTAVWSAGVRARSVSGLPAGARRRAARLAVDEWLRLAGHDRVFAIGDLAAARELDEELPMLSAPAMQEGRYVARAILADVMGRERLAPFHYRDKGTMAVVGRGAAVASTRGLQLTGWIGWVAWLTVHIYYLVGFRNRAAVLVSWGWNYLRRDRPIRMITPVQRDPLVERVLGGGE
jgi:NADH dehydrogenase